MSPTRGNNKTYKNLVDNNCKIVAKYFSAMEALLDRKGDNLKFEKVEARRIE